MSPQSRTGTPKTHPGRRARYRSAVAVLLAAALVFVGLSTAPSMPAHALLPTPTRSVTYCGAPCTGVPATGQTAAQALMTYYNGSPRRFIVESAEAAIIPNEIQPIANGTVLPACNVDYRTLQMLVVIIRKYGSVQISDLNRHCANDGSATCVSNPYSYHCIPSGRPNAVDITYVGGVRTRGNDAASSKLLVFLDSILPTGSEAGQMSGGSGGAGVYCGTYTMPRLAHITRFPDDCTHQHIDLGPSTAALTVATVAPSPSNILSEMTPGDWNGDGKADMLTITSDGSLHLYAGNGSGGFQSGAGAVIGNGWDAFQRVLAPGDFDGDGKPDLLAIGYDGTLKLYAGNGTGGFKPRTGTTIGYGWGGFTKVLTPGDFTGDGKPDLLAIAADGTLKLYAGNGTGGFKPGTGTTIGYGWGGFTNVLGPGDFDGDGKTDLLAIGSDGSLKLYAGNGTGGFKSGTGATIGYGWGIFKAVLGPGDFDGDGRADLLALTSDRTLRLYSGNGRAGFLRTASAAIGNGWNVFTTVLSAHDFNGDGKPDLLGVTSTGDLKLYEGSGTGHFLSGGISIGTGWGAFTQLLAPGDVNGDGKPDLLALTSTGDLKLYPTDGAGHFLDNGTIVGTGLSGLKQLLAPGDVNGDGKPDLLAITTTGDLKLYTGDGTGHFVGSTTISTGWSSFSTVLTPGDVDGDGKADLLGVTPSGDVYRFSGDGAGHFPNASSGTLIGRGWSGFRSVLDPVDFNGDGMTDILTIGTDGTLTLWSGDATRRYNTSYTFVIGTGW
jgi:FG-GAP repeat.